MRQLHLYTGACPNRADNPHLYIFGRYYRLNTINYINAYLQYMGTPAKTINLNNYRINANNIVLEQTSQDFEALFYNVVYAIDVDTDTNYWRCYQVRKTLCQSGKVILQVDVDLWGSYVPFMTIKQAFVNKCNRKIDKGIYDMPKVTALFSDEADGVTKLRKPFYTSYDIPTIDTTTGIAYAPFSRFIVLAYINMTDSSRNGLYDATLTELLAIPLTDLMALVGTELTTLLTTYQTPIDIISDIIGGIYTDKDEKFKATSLKCFLVPNEAVTIHTTGTSTTYERVFKTLSKTYNGNIRFYFVKPSASKFIMPLDKTDIDIDRKYFIGTIDNGVSYTPFIDNEYIFYNFMIKTDGIQVVVEQGFNQQDITNAFEVPINASMQGVTYMERVAYFTKLGYGTAKNIVGGATSSQALAGGAGGVALGAFGGILESAVDIMAEKSKCADTTNLIGNGNASTTFLWGWNSNYLQYLCWPYYITSYKGVLDIKKSTRKYGATFTTYIGNSYDFNMIFKRQLLGELTDYNFTFIRADDLIIDSVPNEVADYIRNKFASGITLNTIELPTLPPQP